jgi:hypothetical protein
MNTTGQQPLRALVIGIALVQVVAGCSRGGGGDKVDVAFRPEVGAEYRYEVKVQSVTTTRLGNEPAERTVDETLLETHATVLAADPEEVRVRVALRRAGSPDRTFIVRFDRAAQLSGVESVEGLPPDILGTSSFPELLPAASAAPPKRPLAPGETWKIDAEPNLPGSGASRLVGTGRLEKVSEVDGRKVASIKAETTLPLRSTTRLRDATLGVDGTETTETTATRALADGAVETARSVTTGDFRLSLTPAAAESALPLTGTMTIELRSQTRRLHDAAPERR